MDSEQSAFLAAQNKHHRYMVFGKKQRYIEVFQCSGEDMNVVLSGGLPAQRAVVSPGMLMWDQNAQSQAAQGPQRTFAAPPPMLPYPAAAAPQANGALVMTAPLKPEQMLFQANLRPQTLELPPASQATSLPPLLSPMKTPVGSQAASAFHPSMLGQYADLSSLAAAQGIMLIPGAAKLPLGAQSYGVSAAAAAPQMSFVNVSSAIDANGRPTHSFAAPKYTLAAPSLLPYAAAAAATTSVASPSQSAQTSGGSKRSFDQAFTGERNNSNKRTPAPRFSSPTSPTPRVQQAAAAAAQFGAVSMTAPMLTQLYPPPMYPPTM